MSDLSFRLTEVRSLLIPLSQFLAWPIFFLITNAISQQPIYFVALLLVLAADIVDGSPRNRGLFRDTLAGGTTALIALLLNDQEGLVVGAVVALAAITRLLQKTRKLQI